MKSFFSKLAWACVTAISAAVAIYSFRYTVQLGFVPPNIGANKFFSPWIIVHAGSASTALLLAPLQFLTSVRYRWPSAHRWLGRTYVISCLLGGISGLVLSRGVSTGVISGIGFATLAILWLGVTLKGWTAARAGNYQEHRRWMIRSFALTFAAVTLRLYLSISLVLGLDFVTAYRVIAWLAWVPNALLAECYLRRSKLLPISD